MFCLEWSHPCLSDKLCSRCHGNGKKESSHIVKEFCTMSLPLTVFASIVIQVWNSRSTSLSSKIWLMCSLVTSIFLYAGESWTLTAELQRRIRAMKMRCYCKILCISCKNHVTNEEVCAKIQQAVGPHEDLVVVRRHKLKWYGHVSHSSGLAKIILQGTVKRVKKKRQTEKEVGRQHKRSDRPGVRQVSEGSGEQRGKKETGCEVICGSPVTPAVKG